MSEKANDILKMDLYGLLDIEITATTKEIKKAYRQKALTCHPDKNPDNPQAVELFHQLSQALEVLTDAAARANYDKICAAKKQAEERNRKLDAKRKKMKLDLEAREQAEDESERDAKLARTQEEEVARLREEGLRLLEEEQQRMREKVQRQTQCSRSSVTPKLKLKWKCKKGDETNGGYSQNVLSHILQKWGEVLNVIVSSKKKGSAVVEFATVRAAESAVKYEIGLRDNPLKISWIEGQPEVIAPSQPGGSMSTQGSVINERDYESLVLMKMRQAAERQKLIEQMQKEDEDES